MAPTCMVLQPSLGHAQTLPSEMSGNPNEVLGFEQMRVPRWLAEPVVRGEHAKSWGELPGMPMITCAERLAGFTTDVDPAPESLVEVLCEDHVGTDLLPFLCRLAPEGFRNARGPPQRRSTLSRHEPDCSCSPCPRREAVVP